MRAILVACLMLGLFVGVAALLMRGDVAAAPETPHERPRLVVLISVDQLRGEFLPRWYEHFTDRGFRRLMRGGAYFDNAYYTYGCSATAPGHATIATGRLPREHGIVGNKWYLEPGVTKATYAVEDSDERVIGVPPGTRAVGKSPRQLLGSTLGDELKLADRQARVFSVSLKDRAAIFTAGKNPDGVFWWDRGSGHFVSSTYYDEALPAYVESFNDEQWADQFVGQVWERLLPAEAYAGCYPLDESWHPALETFGATFPHPLPGEPGLLYYETVYASPYGNELVLEMARRIVREERLGNGPACDLISVGLSSNDPAGHFYGPNSAEILDITVRTDRQLAAFLDWLDGQVGLERCLIALTGDHGVTAANQLASAVRLRAGMIEPGAMVGALDKRFRDILGEEAPEAPLALGFNQPWIYCDPVFAALDEQHDGALSRAGKEVLKAFDGVAGVFTAADLSGPAPDEAELARWLAWRCYHPERSGQFYVHLEPFWYRVTDNLAGHNGGFRSDRHVPLILMGQRVRPGRYATPADTTDLAVTLAKLLDIQAPSDASGRVLHEALDTAPFP